MRNVFLSLFLIFGCSSPPVQPQVSATNSTAIPAFMTDTPVIRLNFILYESQLDKYPDLYNTVIEAVKEWAKIVPIEAVILVSPKQPPKGSIFISLMPNLNGLDKEKNLLGTWSKSSRTIMLDMGDVYEEDGSFKQVYAKTIMLHELGHVFGLPHIADAGILTTQGGDIVVQRNAASFLMFPAINSRNIGALPSKIEIEFARLYILTRLSDDLQ